MFLISSKAFTTTKPLLIGITKSQRFPGTRSRSIIDTASTSRPKTSFTSLIGDLKASSITARSDNDGRENLVPAAFSNIMKKEKERRIVGVSVEFDDDINSIFNAVDLDGSGSIDFKELTNYLSSLGYSPKVIKTLFKKMDLDQSGDISRKEFYHAMGELDSAKDADLIFTLIDTDGSGSIDLDELMDHLLFSSSSDYSREEIKKLFTKMDLDQNNEISREEFRIAMQSSSSSINKNGSSDNDKDTIICPRGYFMNSVKDAFVPLGPIGRLSQKVETSGPFKKVYQNISNLFGIDTKRVSELGVSFALAYSVISNLNGAVSLSTAWYISCRRTGLSPLVPGQWKSLLTSYGMIYGLVQLLRPFRVAAAIAMSKLSAEYLEMTQNKLNCSKPIAIGVQYLMGQFMMGFTALLGITFVSWKTGVPIR